MLFLKSFVAMQPNASLFSKLSWVEFYFAAMRNCLFDWKLYYADPDLDLLEEELRWASGRDKTITDLNHPDASAVRVENSRFDKALNSVECIWKEEYRKLFGKDPSCNLGQHPTVRPSSNAGK